MKLVDAQDRTTWGMSDPNSEVFRLIEQMTGPASHASVTGDPPDPAKLDDLALGDLWAVAHSVRQYVGDARIDTLAAYTAAQILELGRTRKPSFRGLACQDYLLLLANEAEQEPDDAYGFHQDGILKRARFALKQCTSTSFDGFGPVAIRLLARIRSSGAPVMAVALARLVGESTVARVLVELERDIAESPLLLEEARTASRLTLEENLSLAEIVRPDTSDERDAPDTSSDRLSAVPLYVAFAKTGLEAALRRVRLIHAGAVVYASDKAFSLHDSAVLARLARVALHRDDTWLPPLLDELFHKVSLAPTTARTVPSQSVAIALGHAVQAFPTPEAVDTLRGVLATIRHAGVEKKLRRNLPLAERGLANRPRIALRRPPDRPTTKAEVSTLARSLEAGLAVSLTFPYADWKARFGARSQTRQLACHLIWHIVDARGHARDVMPNAECGALVPRDVAGAAVEPDPDHEIRLWHPIDASVEERHAWRSRLVALRLRQPFKQAFREHYDVPDDERIGCTTAMFAGYMVAIHPFLGLARREGWKLSQDSLTRVFGRWKVTLLLADDLFPGASGTTVTRHIEIHALHERKAAPTAMADMPAATLSEILRTVDLLVSVAGIGMTDNDPRDEHIGLRRDLQELGRQSLGATAAIRKDALQRLLHGHDGLPDLRLDARHLRLGPYAIHLATARVTCDGEPVAIETTTMPAAMPWLPYEDKLMSSIVSTVLALAERIRA